MTKKIEDISFTLIIKTCYKNNEIEYKVIEEDLGSYDKIFLQEEGGNGTYDRLLYETKFS